MHRFKVHQTSMSKLLRSKSIHALSLLKFSMKKFALTTGEAVREIFRLVRPQLNGGRREKTFLAFAGEYLTFSSSAKVFEFHKLVIMQIPSVLSPELKADIRRMPFTFLRTRSLPFSFSSNKPPRRNRLLQFKSFKSA